MVFVRVQIAGPTALLPIAFVYGDRPGGRPCLRPCAKHIEHLRAAGRVSPGSVEAT